MNISGDGGAMSSLFETTVCILTKSPVAGEVKTRLVPTFGENSSRDLACSFLFDTVESCKRLGWARIVVATTLPVAEEVKIAAEGLEIWDQGGGDLGARIERVLKRALSTSKFAMLIGADSPGMPLARFVAARSLLSTNDAVLGPAEDGGFYLIGLSRLCDGLFCDLPWSREDTCEKTASRLRDIGLNPAFLDSWFDVDRAEDVFRLFDLLKSGEVRAPKTLETLKRIFG